MSDALSYKSEVKKGLLSLLMFQLYSDKKTIYREYIQNALDAISQAVAQGILAERKDGLVTIDISNKAKQITIRDNGTGIGTVNAVRVLLDISASTKDGISQAGQFGIGRLVGGGYCHELRFRTTAKGEQMGTEITFDVDRIWKMVKEDKEDFLATEVIDVCTHRSHFEADEADHFFEVILNHVKDDAAADLLDEQKVVEYLNAVGPVEYKPEFKNTLIYQSGKMQPAFESLHSELEKVQIFVGKTKVLKQYGLTVNGTKDRIDHLEYFKLEDEQFGMLGWGWFALTKFTIQIPQSDKLAGIRLRKHNIQIGDATLLSGTNFWREPRGNSYFYGEVFVTHEQIEPNGARDGLAPSPATTAFNKKLTELFTRLRDVYTKANAIKKCVDKIHEGIKRIQAEGKEDYKSKDLIDNNGIDKFTSLKNRAASPFVAKMIALYQPNFDKAQKDAQNTISSLHPNGEQKYDADNTRSLKDSPTPAKSNPRAEKQADATTTISTPKDKTETLQGIVDEDKIRTIQRVFEILERNCPSARDRKLVEELEIKIVEDFAHDK